MQGMMMLDFAVDSFMQKYKAARATLLYVNCGNNKYLLSALNLMICWFVRDY